ncbi:hypothetical protein PP899_gp29 [Agrobacterium phage Atu_ph08]|uniref:Uncharacterized protein n=1 Tax=Agrobacterium phage Atu_ph08 TaxID=2024265 RepID=A0A223W037_9CAUD|nr:hypothetical protein [Agrobacterium sp. DE0009]YP_010660320.1 hypothetical protein PP899_gp29 [Agrobacterium phage Atu_ph08]ASV44785.1 hypothetical protein [Agrobacterium phage Atu_ph08]
MTDVMVKKPADVLDYDIDFARWLPSPDRLSGAATTIANSSAAVDRTEYTDTNAKVWISGGTLGETANVTVTVTTQEGRTKQFVFNLKIKECH